MFTRLFDNPVIYKELRGRMRDNRSFILLTVYLSLIAGFVLMMYFIVAEANNAANLTPDDRQILGKTIFGTCVLIELLLVSFIAPGLTSGAITGERELRTLDLLKTTLITPAEIVFGKLNASFVYLLLLIFTVLPIQSAAFVVGGVGLGEFLVATLMLIVTAVFYAALGIFFSSIFKRTLAATVSAYGSILLTFLGIFVFFFMMAILESIIDSPAAQNMFMIGVWFVICTNPLLAAIVSEAILIAEQSLFMASSSFMGSGSFPMISPWIIYTIWHIALTAALLALSIAFVKRPEK